MCLCIKEDQPAAVVAVPNHPIDVESDSESDDHEEEEDDMVIRAKWQMDGATTLDEAVQKLEGFIAYLKELKAGGWELRNTIDDDWGFVYKKE